MQKVTSARAQVSRKPKSKEEIAMILRTLPYDQGFHFYVGVGELVDGGETATSLEMFADKLQTVPALSLNFHLRRGDFQKWIKGALGDDVLARRISQIAGDISGEEARKTLLETTKNR